MTALILAIPELNNDGIRATGDGRFSVLDLIRIAGGKKAHHKVWERIQKSYPEVVTGCQDYKFPGQGQRPTPVVTAEQAEIILELLGCHPNQKTVTQNKFFPKAESQTIAVISKAFTDCDPCTQFFCCGYRIDLYLAKPRIAIECDENGHKSYSIEKEVQREQQIKNALGCSFVRFNPNDSTFNIGDIIFKIRGLV